MEQLDAILLTGDIADHGLVDEYEEARALITSTRHRVLICPGNHDRREAYRQVLLAQPPSDEPINDVHEVGGVRFAMCDSSIPGRADGYLSDETLQWLDGVLTAAPDAPSLVAFHHPPVVLHSPFIDAIRQHGADRLAQVLDRHQQVVAVLCGHAHTPATSTFAGRPLLVAPGVKSTLRLPWELRGDLDESMPPAIAFHVLDDGRLTTHHRLVI
jgi:3',5'-cyclic AMP phosphodiesterase CpdA